MRMDREHVISALDALAQQLDYLGGARVELVVCGGTALQVLGLVQRTTRDVDVLALAETLENGVVELLPARGLPEDVRQAALTVARDLALDPDWINTHPVDSSVVLPVGLAERLHTHEYGKRLVVHFIDRRDQIYLKLHAVVDRDAASRHLADLRTLRPSHDELVGASRWCLAQDAGEQFRDQLLSCLEQIGYRDVAETIGDEIP